MQHQVGKDEKNLVNKKQTGNFKEGTRLLQTREEIELTD